MPGTGRQKPKEISINLTRSDRVTIGYVLCFWKKKILTGVAGFNKTKQKPFFFLSLVVKLRLIASGLRQIVSSLHPRDCFLVAFMITRIELQILHYYFQSSARCESAKLNKDLNLRFLRFFFRHYLFPPYWSMKNKK